MDIRKQQEIGEAVKARNPKKLASLVECNATKAFHWSDASFLESSESVNHLYGLLKLSLSSQYVQANEGLSFSQILDALLLIPPCFETPWMAVLQVASHIPTLDAEVLHGTISALEEFITRSLYLSNARAGAQSSSEQSDIGSSAASKWLNKIFRTLLDFLLPIRIKQKSMTEALEGGVIRVVSDLAGTIFSTARQVDNHLFDNLVGSLLDRKYHLMRCGTWLGMVESLLPIMRLDQVNSVQKSLRSQIDSYKLKISLKDFKKLLGVSFRQLAASAETDSNIPHPREQWFATIWQILHVSSSDPKVYSELEDCLLSTLANAPRLQIESFLQVSQTTILESGLPTWISLNILVGSIQCLHKSNSSRVSRLLAYAVKKSPPSDDRLKKARGLLLRTLFGPDHDTLSQSILHDDNLKLDHTNIVQATDSVAYKGTGCFSDEDGEVIGYLSRAGNNILSGVCLGKSTEEYSLIDSSLTLRAIRMFEVAKAMVDSPTYNASSAAVTFMVVVSTVLYAEFPSLRSTLVHLIGMQLSAKKQALAKSSPAGSLSCAAATVNMLVRSFSHVDTKSNLDPLCELLEVPVRTDIFCHLILATSSLPRARQLILTSSKRIFQRHFVSTWEQATEALDGSSGGAFQGCLLGFLELVRTKTWAACEREAWKLLSECMVLNEPHLSLFDRRWLYHQIQEHIDSGELSLEAAEHFLRAAIIRLSAFFSEKTSESRFVLDRVVMPWGNSGRATCPGFVITEDIPLLLHLILSMLGYLISAGPVDDWRVVLLSRGREAILSSILAYKDKSNFDKHRSVEKFVESCRLRNTEQDSFALYCGTAISLISCILEDSMRYQSRPTTRGVSPSTSAASLQKAIRNVLSREKAALRPLSSRSLGDSERPSWIKREWAPAKVVPDDALRTIIESKRLELFDFMVELLFKPNLPARRPQSSLKSHSRSVTRAIGVLLQRKRSLGSSSEEKGAGLLSGDTCARTATAVFSIALSVVKDVASGCFSLGDAEDILSPILEYCEGLCALPEDSDATTPSLLERVWALYQSIAAEKPAARFIEYLENSDTNCNIETEQSICSLRSIRGGDDIDNVVQTLRLYVIRALQRCISSTSFDVVEHKDEVFDSCELLVGMLHSLSHDLRSGLKGTSGGITSELYMVYLSSIEECSALFFEICLTRQSSMNASIFLDVSDVLASILSSFTLDEAALFRFSFLLATATLPSLYREVLRQVPADKREVDIGRLGEFDGIFLSNVFSDCMRILSRWSVIRDPDSLPWSDIAGTKHVDDVGGAVIAIAGEQTTEQSTSTPTEISDISRESSLQDQEMTTEEGYATDLGQGSRFIRLQSKEVWSWTLSCILIVIEGRWLESFNAMVPSSRRPLKQPKNPPSLDRVAYSRHRQAELVLCCKRVAGFFYSNSESSVDHNGQPSVIDMLAMNLPSAPRHRLCGVLNSMSLALDKSVDTVHNFLLKKEDAPCDDETSLPFFEAMCCLSAWLSHEATRAGISEGVPRWLSLLKRKRPPGEAAPKRSDILALISRLSSAVTRQCAIISGLRKLKSLLCESRDQFDDSLSVVINSFFGGGIAEMIRLVSSKVSLLERVMPKSDTTQESFPSFPVGRSENEKKRPRRASKWRPRKRSTARSRNKVVDIFMRLDGGADDSEGRTTDAFVDLEDFLVEG